MFKISITLLIIFALQTAMAEKKYSLTDLEALQKSNSWKELLEHIEDVVPAKRDKKWNEILNTALEKGLDDFIKKDHSYELQFFTRRFMDRYPQAQKNSQLSFRVAKAVRKKVSDTKAIKYFLWGLSKNPTKQQCSDEDLKLSVISSMNLSQKSDSAKFAKKVAFGPCFSELKSTIKDAINTSKNGMSNGCQGMIQHKALKGATAGKCKDYLKK
ncbi:MAG: hypothetical protein HOO06_14005 [Bdellovibrionaceae bacterium]|jgi:hypothetical protein|nr:hypothetical protein [Pseudobdellovibrionaceae bacterium]